MENEIQNTKKDKKQTDIESKECYLFEADQQEMISLFKDSTLSLLSSQSPISLEERQKKFTEQLLSIPIIVINYIRQNRDSSFVENLLGVLDFTTLEKLILSTSHSHSKLIVSLVNWMRQHYSMFGTDNYSDEMSYTNSIQKSIITFLQSPLFFSGTKDDVISYFLHAVYSEKQCETILLKLSN